MALQALVTEALKNLEDPALDDETVPPHVQAFVKEARAALKSLTFETTPGLQVASPCSSTLRSIEMRKEPSTSPDAESCSSIVSEDPGRTPRSIERRGELSTSPTLESCSSILSEEKQFSAFTADAGHHAITVSVPDNFSLEVLGEDDGEVLRMTYNGRTSYFVQGISISFLKTGTSNQYTFLTPPLGGIHTWASYDLTSEVEDLVQELNDKFAHTRLFFFSPPPSFDITSLVVMTIQGGKRAPARPASFLLASGGHLRLLGGEEQGALAATEKRKAISWAESGDISETTCQKVLEALDTLVHTFDDATDVPLGEKGAASEILGSEEGRLTGLLCPCTPPSPLQALVTKARAMLRSVACCRRRGIEVGRSAFEPVPSRTIPPASYPLTASL